MYCHNTSITPFKQAENNFDVLVVAIIHKLTFLASKIFMQMSVKNYFHRTGP